MIKVNRQHTDKQNLIESSHKRSNFPRQKNQQSIARYFTVNKPFGYLSQFTSEGGHPTLGDLHEFPPHVYPVGRLDRDSEGLLILTDDKSLNERLLHPSNAHKTFVSCASRRRSFCSGFTRIS